MGTPNCRRLTRKEAAATMRLLEAHLIEVQPGLYSYAEGWDDDKIAAAAFPDFPGNAKTTAASYRTREFGPFPQKVKAAPPAPAASLEARVVALEAQLAALLSELGVAQQGKLAL